MNKQQDPFAMLIEAMAIGTDAMITRQEAQGQRDLVNSAVLPKRGIGCTREQIAAMGIVFGEDADDIFVNVTLPDGWKKVPTSHSMWSDLLDAQGRKRAHIFYKAAFYDRNAHMSLCRRINVTRRYGEDDRVSATVERDGVALFETTPITQGHDRAYFDAIDAADLTATLWADAHYPEWRDVGAYWD